MINRRDAVRLVLAAVALTLLAALGGTTAPAAAASSSGVTVSLAPRGAAGKSGYFVFTGRPGRVIHGTVAITNTSRTAAGTVRLYAVDATTGQTTGAVYRSAGQPRHDVGRWLHLSSSRVTLGRGAHAIIRYRVRVPRGARPGQHLGAIVAQPTSPLHRYGSQRQGDRFQIKVQALTVLAVQVDVPGPTVQRLAVGGCHVGGPHGYQTLYIGMRNTGDSLLKGSGRLMLSTGGRTLRRRRFAVDTFVPRTQVAYPIIIGGHPLRAGRYRAKVTVRYGRHHTTHGTMTCAVSAHSITQVFGSPSSDAIPSPGGGGGGGTATWLLVVGGVAVFAIGFGGAGLLYRVRLSHR